MLYIYLLEDLITDANTEEESTISISEKEAFLLLENIFVFAVTFMVYGGHRHFEQYSSH